MGALKVGDMLSTAASVTGEQGPTVANGRILSAANDNSPVTITDIQGDTTATRVYNFQIESLPGEITHNYLVGDDALWVHNIHGNSNASPRTTTLYRLICNGEFMKWGISSNLARRYAKTWLTKMGCDPKAVREYTTRAPCRALERRLNTRFPGPWN